MPARRSALPLPAATLSVLLLSLTAAGWMMASCSLVLDLEACEHDDHCPDDHRCTEDNLCEPQPQPNPQSCRHDQDCPDDHTCTPEQLCESIPEECDEDFECPAGFICDQQAGCIDSSAQCIDDDECVDLFDDMHAVCEDGTCSGDAELTGGPCQQLYGDADHRNAFMIGVVMQLSGVGGGFGEPMLDAIRIATRDFNAIGGVDGQPVGLIACDTKAEDQRTAEAAEHLVEDAGAEAVIGFNSSQVHDNYQYLVDNEVVVMSPSATATSISELRDDGLVWRTAPSDELQSAALAGLVEYTAGEYLAAQGVDYPRVTLLVRRNDQWSEGLHDVLVDELPSSITGSDNFRVREFPNVGDGDPAEYTQVAANIAADTPHPHLLVVLGSADSWKLIGNIDAVLEDEPLFIGADAMKNAEEAADADPDLEGRIWGTGPRNVAQLHYEPYTIFRLKFEEEMNDDADRYQFVANAYDALYTIAFAAAAEGYTGPDIARGLHRLAEGEPIFPTPDEAADAMQLLSEGGTIDYQGASGPINFDDNGDPEPMPIALWCFEDGTVPEHTALLDPDDGQFSPATCDPDYQLQQNDDNDDPEQNAGDQNDGEDTTDD